MVETIEAVGTDTDLEAVWADVVRVANRIPPLWDLGNYVAVNPFLGFAGVPIAEAALAVGDGLGARVLPGLDFYRARWKAGAFSRADLSPAARRAGYEPRAVEAILSGACPMPLRSGTQVPTFAERHDRAHGTDWNGRVIRSAAHWCAVHASEGGSSWSLSDGRGLFASWLEAARADRSLDIAGLRGFRNWAKQLPETPLEAIASALSRLGVRTADREPYLYRLLGGLYGWASYLRRANWEKGTDDPGAVADLLAVRVCTDAAVAELVGRPAVRPTAPAPAGVEDEAVQMVFQDALEDGFVRTLLGRFAARPPASKTHPAVQAVFCIDVRSEPLRRHLESQSQAVETRGFAGFFGVTLDWQAGGGSSARCPVLLKPGIILRPACGSSPGAAFGKLQRVQTAPAAAFSFVEVLGLAYGVGLVADAFAAVPPMAHGEDAEAFGLDPDGHGGGIPPDARLDLAVGILKNMGFRDTFARLVLFCGHESRSANNPHAAGLDCGACGGHGGAVNARVAAAVLNDPEVRVGLPARGWIIPTDTHFLPGVHDTSVDEVRLLDVDRVPADRTADLDQLRTWLAAAGSAARAERAAALGLGGQPVSALARFLARRSRDWSEVRPEWALARNAAFIAARRDRTRGADLGGRTFLHEYDAAADPDDAILTLILSAPMVVASWINLQYFASTVDNGVFGAGDKALHNRVGTLGVVLGNGGDLRTGLPLQSVHAACGRWFHEPLRLQVVVEAERERIDRVLAATPSVRELVENGWVRLFALSPESSETFRWVPGPGWERVDGAP